MDDNPRYAFLGHESACEALRQFWAPISWQGRHPWPRDARRLPSAEHCVTNQKEAKNLIASLDLASHNVTTMPIDLLVPTRAAGSRGKTARFHVWSRPLPAGSMLRLADALFASGPELTVLELCGSHGKLEPLLDPMVSSTRAEQEVNHMLGLDRHVAIDSPLEWESNRRLVEAAAVACEFAGTYRLGTAGAKTNYGAPRLMSLGGLRSAATSVTASRRTSMESRALRVAELAFDNSASPMETSLALLLTLPLDFGGFGLERPRLNVPVDVSGYRGEVADRDDVTPDFLWEGRRLALEYDSREHHEDAGPRQLAKDAARANILTALGYRLIRVTPANLASLASASLLARQVAWALGRELERPSEVQLLRREKLYRLLMPKR